MLHTLCPGLFKHIINWIQGFLKKHSALQALDNAWKARPPSQGFFLSKKGDRNLAQWQGKEMRNLRGCLLGAIAVALCNDPTDR